jgi:hypothetical protein
MIGNISDDATLNSSQAASRFTKFSLRFANALLHRMEQISIFCSPKGSTLVGDHSFQDANGSVCLERDIVAMEIMARQDYCTAIPLN